MKIALNGELKFFLAGLVAIGLAIAFVLNVEKSIEEGPDKDYRRAPTETADAPRREVPVKGIKAIDKEAVEKKVDLPEEVRKDDKKHVLATAVVEPHKGKTDVQAVFDEVTGDTEIFAKRRPLPFLELDSEFEVGARYGFTTGPGGQEAQIYGRWTPIHIRLSKRSASQLHIGLYGELNSEPEAKAMVDAFVRF